jgi:ATP-dependent DNA helicase RecG
VNVADRSTRLRSIVGTVGEKLEKSRDVGTVGDLLDFLPRRYLDPDVVSDLSALHEGDFTMVIATVKSAVMRSMRQRKGRMLTVTLTDGKHDMTTTFFKPYGHEGRLTPGRRGMFAGKVGRYRGTFQLTHPSYHLIGQDGDELDVYDGGLVPVYLDVKNVTSLMVTEAVKVAFHHLDDLPDPVPPQVRSRRGLAGELEAYRLAHLPRDRHDVARAMRRMRYAEAFVVQTALAVRRAAHQQQPATPRRAVPGGLLEEFDARLPFELTKGQREVGDALAVDLASSHPMHRLLQGEVGSGKTVVALRAMLTVIDSGGQAALLAPTEVLAQQHHRSITAMLADLAEGGMLGGSEIGTRVALLTGSQPAGIRKKNLLEAASGEAGIVIGTHALIQDHVQFADLGLVVVDEQHRFGVEQRDALRGKAAQPPHVLVMTATPIPRTVAMTVFGDMETSTLAELPQGRSPISTHLVPGSNERWVQRTWERVAEEVRAGHQAYVVCPRIGDPPGDAVVTKESSDEEDLAAEGGDDGAAGPAMTGVYEQFERLRETPALAGLRLAVLHGRMPADEKDATMRAFAAGEIDVMVATTVIEVGVDVPGATVMVIVDADRFGVSQLHQLRGRVGRGSAPGICLLMSDVEEGPALERLTAVEATTDGFELSRVDLEQRREGDVLGAHQSGGRRQLRFLQLLRDETLIVEAQEDARALVSQDPALAEHPVLRDRIVEVLDEEQVTYLERG